MAQINKTGVIRKMHTSHNDVVGYRLPIGEELVDLNPLIGQDIELNFSGLIFCINCGRKIKKSFNQGYCYPCFRSLAECDQCIMRPELCHFDQGTCRDEAWGLANCMQPHFVYLANSSGLKVGITRHTQIPTRWMDQGASQAMPLLKVNSRLISGLVEVMFKSHISDRTDWRKMLKGDPPDVDLTERGEQLIQLVIEDIKQAPKINENDYEIIEPAQIYDFEYPVEHYPEKVKAHNFDKTAQVQGRLDGIKGQYLILDTGVLNIRKFGGYEVSLLA